MKIEQIEHLTLSPKSSNYTPHLNFRRLSRSPLLVEKTSFEIANSLATKMLNILPPEVREDPHDSLSIDRGYSQKTELLYTDLLSNFRKNREELPLDETLLIQEVELSIDILANYLTLMKLNRQYKRISVFLPFTYVKQLDALDPLTYIFNHVSHLVSNNSSHDRIVHSLKRYIEGTSEGIVNPPLIEGVQREVVFLLEEYTSSPGKILYPCEKFLRNIINPEKISSVLNEIQSFLTNEDTYLLKILEKQLKEYAYFIETCLLPNAPNETIVPTEIYRIYLALEGINEEPEALIKRARHDFDSLYQIYQVLAEEIADESGLDTNNPAEVLSVLEKQNRISNPNSIMQLYTDVQAEIEEIIQQYDLVSLPTNKMAIRIGTPAEESILPVPHLNAPNLLCNKGDKWPEFVLCDLSSHGSPYAAYSLIVHEGRPGCDLQYNKLMEAFLAKKINLI